MKCNSSKFKELFFRKKRQNVVHKMISNIQQCTGLTVLGFNFQQDCRNDKFVKDKLAKANKCLYVFRSLRKEEFSQLEADIYDHSFTHTQGARGFFFQGQRESRSDSKSTVEDEKKNLCSLDPRTPFPCHQIGTEFVLVR